MQRPALEADINACHGGARPAVAGDKYSIY